MDRISNLPDEIICHILSFISTKEAALTCVLSKRWRNLFAFSPNLCFEKKDFPHSHTDLKTFIKFLDRVLAVSGNSPIKKFSLNYGNVGLDYHTNLWIYNVLSRGGVLELQLDIIPIIGSSLLPLEVFTCKTLVKLKLRRSFFIHIPQNNTSLPSLKTLFLDSIFFRAAHRTAFETLISACPVLEELVMCDVTSWDGKQLWYEKREKLDFTVSSPTLQRLTMKCNRRLTPHSQSITFDTPSLAYLDYYGTVAEAYPTINIGSLVEAKLDLTLSVGRRPIKSNQDNLIKGLRNVQILNLSTLGTMETFYFFREAIPVFKNLIHLSITIELNKCSPTLPLLLKNSPNLETLIIKGVFLYYYDKCGREPEAVCECLSGYSCLLSCRVKVLEITLPGGIINLVLRLLKHLLEILSCLELLKVRSRATKEKEKLQLRTNVQNLHKSSKCKIQFEF